MHPQIQPHNDEAKREETSIIICLLFYIFAAQFFKNYDKRKHR